MAKIAVIFLAVMAIQQASCGTVKKTPPVTKSQLDELIDQVSHATSELTTSIQKATGIKDSKQVFDVVEKQVELLSQNVKKIGDTLKTELKSHSGETEVAIKEFTGKLEEISTSILHSVSPDTEAKFKELSTNVNTSVKKTVDEFQKFVKAIEPETKNVQDSLAKVTKSLLDQFLEKTKTVQTEIQHTIDSHVKTHTKH